MFVERLDATHRFEERYRTMTPEEREADADALADEVRRLLAQRKTVEIDGEAAEVRDEVQHASGQIGERLIGRYRESHGRRCWPADLTDLSGAGRRPRSTASHCAVEPSRRQ